MSLVNYGSSSDSEASDVESTTQRPSVATNIPSSASSSTKRSLSSLLPPPKAKKTVYVDLPKLAVDDVDEEEPKPKRTKITSGLGLADLLPKPKNTPAPLTESPVPVTKTTTDKAFVPYALAKKMKIKEREKERERGRDDVSSEQELGAVKDSGGSTTEAAGKETVTDETEKEEDQDDSTTAVASSFTGSFFKVGKELKGEEPLMPKVAKTNLPALGPTMTVEKPKAVEEEEVEEESAMTAADAYAYDPNAMYSADPNIYYQYYNQQQQAYEETSDNGNDINLEQLIGRKAKGDSNIQFKTINQQDILPSEEWRAAQTLTQAPKFKTGPAMQVSKLAAKKNNIMALAAHAVNNQERLDEMFAANKRNKRDASQKYGF